MEEFIRMLAELPPLLTQVRVQLAENSKLLAIANEQLGNTRMYEQDAARYLNVEPCTMYQYRLKGLPFEKIGRVVSYFRKDLDAWRAAGQLRNRSVK